MTAPRPKPLPHALLTLAFVSAAAWAIAPVAHAQVPKITEPVTDLAGALSDSDTSRITRELQALREASGVQMAVLIVDTTSGVDIAYYAQRAFDAWGGGSEERDDGVLFVLAISDRRSRLHLGYGLEPVITDGQAVAMLDALRPDLKAQRYGDAGVAIVESVAEAVDYLEPQGLITPRPPPPVWPWWSLPFGTLLAFGAAFGRRVLVGDLALTKGRANRHDRKRAQAKAGKKGESAVASESALVSARASQVLRERLEVPSRTALWLICPALVALFGYTFGSPGYAKIYVVVWYSFAGFGTYAARRRHARAYFIAFLVIAGFFALGAAYAAFRIGDISELETLTLAAMQTLSTLLFALIPTLESSGSWSAGSGGSSSSWSSSSYSSSSSSSYSSSSSSSSWSGGGGSSGGGGASSSW